MSASDLTLEYRGFAEAVVRKLMNALSLPYQNADEYISAGLLGLVEASERFNPENGADFRAFAFLRIRGAVIDSIRSSSELSGRAYRYARALQAAHDVREEDFLTEAKTPETGTKERFARVLQMAASGALALRLSFEDAENELSNSQMEMTGEELLMAKQKRSRFRELVKKLPDKERLIVEEFYFNEKSFSQIIQENPSLSKSWVSRLHSRALERLKGICESHEM